MFLPGCVMPRIIIIKQANLKLFPTTNPIWAISCSVNVTIITGYLPCLSEYLGIQITDIMTPTKKQAPRSPSSLYGAQRRSIFCTQLIRNSGSLLMNRNLFIGNFSAQISCFVQFFQVIWWF